MSATLLKSLALSSLATAVISLTACSSAAHHKGVSETKITNGVAADGYYPSVVMLRFSVNGGNAICTGTFVNSSQVITAGHCAADLISSGTDASAMTFKRGGTTIRAVDLVANPNFTGGGQLSPYDIAVVTFPAGSAPESTALYGSSPQVGQSFTIVGYGVNNYSESATGGESRSGAGVKRAGTNTIQAISANGMIQFYGVPTATSSEDAPGENAASGSGDSGGPLFIDGALAGTTSGGGVKALRTATGSKYVKVSNYVNLADSVNSDFLSQALTAGN